MVGEQLDEMCETITELEPGVINRTRSDVDSRNIDPRAKFDPSKIMHLDTSKIRDFSKYPSYDGYYDYTPGVDLDNSHYVNSNLELEMNGSYWRVIIENNNIRKPSFNTNLASKELRVNYIDVAFAKKSCWNNFHDTYHMNYY